MSRRLRLPVNHQGQFPAVTISFNLAEGVSLGDAVNEVEAAERAWDCLPTFMRHFQGTAQAFQDVSGERALADPGGAGRRCTSCWECFTKVTSIR